MKTDSNLIITIISILTVFIAFLTLLFNAKKLLFVNTITKERTNYIEKLRINLADFINHIKLDEKECVEKKLTYLKLLLNPSNKIDSIFINQLNKVYEYYKSQSNDLDNEIDQTISLSQKILKFEWDGIKNETKYFVNKKRVIETFYKSLFLLYIIFPISGFAQITIGSVDKNIATKIEQKPIPYDSLINYKNQENPIDYKMYVGLKIFLAPFDKKQKSEYTGRVYPFIFKDSIGIYNSDENIKLIKADNIGRQISENYTKFATTKYKPYYYFSGIVNGNSYTSISTDGEVVSNKYYTVSNVYIGEEKDSIISKIAKELNNLSQSDTYVDKDLFVSFDAYDYSDKIFQIQDDITKEKSFVFDLSQFIFVPYFVKQKEIYNSSKLIAILNNTEDFKTTDYSKNEDYLLKKKSIWTCEVTLLSKKEIFDKNAKIGSGSYFIAYKLTNNEGVTLIFRGLNDKSINFIPYEKYIKEEEIKKLNEQERVARIKREEQLKREQSLSRQKERKQMLSSKFGNEIAIMILDGNVQIGMTKEMCQYAWGNPYDKNITIVQNMTYEHWYYSWKKSLHFENNILKRIEK